VCSFRVFPEGQKLNSGFKGKEKRDEIVEGGKDRISNKERTIKKSAWWREGENSGKGLIQRDLWELFLSKSTETGVVPSYQRR